MFLPAELERGTEVLQFHVCCKAIDQNFDCGCERCTIHAFGLANTKQQEL